MIDRENIDPRDPRRDQPGYSSIIAADTRYLLRDWWDTTPQSEWFDIAHDVTVPPDQFPWTGPERSLKSLLEEGDHGTDQISIVPQGDPLLGCLALALPHRCKHTVSMPNVLVRDVPDDVHTALQRKAQQRDQSLQQYLSAELRKLAARRSIDDVLDDVEAQRGGHVGFTTAVADLNEERSER